MPRTRDLTPQPIGYRYTGDGAFYNTVPAVDLTPDEYDAIPEYARWLYTATYDAPAPPEAEALPNEQPAELSGEGAS